MSALLAALAAVRDGTGCPRCLVGRRDLFADPTFRCEVCVGTGVPHFALLAAAEAMRDALMALREAAEDSVYNSAPTVSTIRAYEQADIAARAALAKAEGRA